MTIEKRDCVGATFHSHKEIYPVRLLSESNRIEGPQYLGAATRLMSTVRIWLIAPGYVVQITQFGNVGNEWLRVQIRRSSLFQRDNVFLMMMSRKFEGLEEEPRFASDRRDGHQDRPETIEPDAYVINSKASSRL